MKIENLKINAYGNLEEKEIEFGEHINIVHGKNESGKSTLLKFITNIFYGTSKNKKGKEYSDYDRYKPWKSEEFSGKLAYKLENGEKYEVFREFGGKKNPKIYNDQLEDISKQYAIDKNTGNQFFFEQTGVDENMFLSTLVSMQQEVKLDHNMQNILLQKVANLASTGDDSISYKKAQEKINKKQIEEIGTNRSQGRPINIIKEEKFKIYDEIGELENYKQRKKQIEEEKKENKIELEKIDQNIKIIKKLKSIEENEKLGKEKIRISQNLKQNQEQRKEEIEKQKEEILNNIKNQEEVRENEPLEKNKTKTRKIIAISLFILSIIIEILSIFLIKNLIISIIFTIMIIATLIYAVREIKQEKKMKQKIEKAKVQEKEKQEEIVKQKEKIEKFETEINILKTNIKEQEQQIEEELQKLDIDKNKQIERLKEEFKNSKLENMLNIANIQDELENIERQRNNKQLEYNSLEIEENTILPKLEKIALLEEKLEEINQTEKELEENNKSIEIAKQILEIAYKKMKQNITPKLTQELSKTICKISDNKYSKISLNEENGIIVEKENGEYIEAEKLSVGTIDQLYLSLRLALLNELSSESMPIILDEAFAYYDDARLENILNFLHTEFTNSQIIILTCTNREESILEKLNIKYNKIEM